MPLSGVAQKHELKVGVVVPLSGAGAAFGEHARNALTLASEEINAAAAAGNSGDETIKVKLLFEDSKSEPRLAVAAYHRLVSIEKVDAVVGELWDFLVTPLIPLSASSKTLTISPTAMDFSAEILSQSPYFWSMGSKVESLRTPTEQFLDLHPELKTVGIFCWNNHWGEAHLAMWRKVLQERGKTIAVEACEQDFSSDLRVVMRRIANPNPSMVFASTIIGTFAKRKFELKSTAFVLSTSDLLEVLRDPLFDKKMVEGYYFTDWRDPEEFRARYIKRFATTPIHEASKSYYALLSIKNAALIRKAGESLAYAIRRVSFKKSDGELIDFSNQPFANNSPAYLYRVTNGEAVAVSSLNELGKIAL
jgi:ABC-type branched-subunit amino acid transport system substrate-binding protein